jgi:hypothetical protein
MAPSKRAVTVTETMKKLLTVGCGLLLAACAAKDSPPAADVTLPSVTTTESESSAPPTEGDPAVNERGNIEVAVGEELTLPDGGTVVIDKIEVMPLPCPTDDEYSQSTPEHGHFVRLDVRVATAPAGGAEVPTQPSFSEYNFQYIQANGVTFSASMGTFAAFTCLPQEQMFPSGGLGPGQQFTGSLVLDVPDTTGVLIYFPDSAGYGTGYEFSLGG